MNIKDLDRMLVEQEHETRLLRSTKLEQKSEPYFLSLRLNPDKPDDAFILRHIQGRKGNASLMRVLLLAHFKTVEAGENV